MKDDLNTTQSERFSPKSDRKFFTKLHDAVPLPDLIESQKDSYDWFL